MMPMVIGPDGAGTDGPLVVSPANIGGGFNSIFIPTAREFSEVYSPHARNASTCFVRGYKDRVGITVSGGATWSWRRTVFLFKGDRIREYFLENGQGQQYDALGDGSGNMTARVIGPMVDHIATLIRGLLYRGSQEIDWYDPFTAAIDTTRVTLLSDRLTSINPSNESGRTKLYNMWTPVNKNIMYTGYESSEVKISTPYSTESKVGCGDMYIFDQVRRDTGSATTGIPTELKFSPEGTFY